MDRRTLVTGGLASLLAAIGLGRVVTRPDGPDSLAIDAAPSSTPSSPAAPRPSATLTVDGTPPVARTEPTVAPSEAPPADPSATAEPTPAATTETAKPTPEPTAEMTPEPQPEPTPEPSPTATASGPVVLPVLCRDAWRAAPVQDGLQQHQLRRITIHHTAVVLDSNTKAPARLRQHQRYHQDQGWADIAYHVSVDRNGHLYELRTTDARGDTFTSYDPAGHLLILAEGNFDQQAPSDDQLEGLAQLIAWGHTRFGLPLESVSGHRDHAGTTCPGDALYTRLGDLRARATELVRAGGVELASRCGSDGRSTVAAIERGDA